MPVISARELKQKRPTFVNPNIKKMGQTLLLTKEWNIVFEKMGNVTPGLDGFCLVHKIDASIISLKECST